MPHHDRGAARYKRGASGSLEGNDIKRMRQNEHIEELEDNDPENQSHLASNDLSAHPGEEPKVVAISDEAGSGKTRETGIIIIDDHDDDQQIVEEEGGDEGDSVGDGGEEYDGPQADGAEDAGNDVEHIANVPSTSVTHNHKSKSSASPSRALADLHRNCR